MPLTLYHSTESTCAQKVRLVMAEKGLQWEEIRLNLRKGEQFSPDYLKLNPKAVVPTLVHDGRAIRESSVINEYLEEVFPHPPLRPDDPHGRAIMRLLIKAVDEEVHPSIGILSYAIVLRHQMDELKTADELAAHFERVADPMRRQRQMRAHHQGLASPAAVQATRTLDTVIGQMEEALGAGNWLAGAAYSLADATALPYMVRARALALDGLWTDSPRFAQWFSDAEAHAATLQLTEPWGSDSFAAQVAGCVQIERANIRALLIEHASQSASS